TGKGNWFKSNSRPDAPVSVSGKVKDKRPQIEVVQINLTNRGFEPAMINLQPGDYAFALSNRSDYKNPTFSLYKESGEKMKDVPFPNNKRLSGLLVKLTTGRYLLKFSQAQNLVCSISVSN